MRFYCNSFFFNILLKFWENEINEALRLLIQTYLTEDVIKILHDRQRIKKRWLKKVYPVITYKIREV